MTHSSVHAKRALMGGLVLGAVGDALLWESEGAGINLLACVLALVAVTVIQHRRSGGELSAEARALMLTGVAFAAAMAWRDSPALKLISLGSATIALCLASVRGGMPWIRRSSVSAYVEGSITAARNVVTGSVSVLRNLDWSPSARAEGGKARRRARAFAVGRGLALAAPVVVVFGALFASADAVFAGFVAETIRIDVETLVSHVLIVGGLSWPAAGYLFGFLSPPSARDRADDARRRLRLGITETAIVLGLLDLLFLVFVIVQFRYLFGGSSVVEVTPGLTYAEYARRGFFELVMAVLLVLPLLLAADALLRRDAPRHEWLFRSLAGLQIALVLAVTASALERMRLYREAYGLTEDRIYATALLLLIGSILVWFAATVMRGRRRHFAFGALAMALFSAAALHVVNPDAVVARTNITRSAHTELDIRHTVTLSGDAVPVLIDALPDMPVHASCAIARRLLTRWTPDERTPLRAWSWSSARARAAVSDNAASLHRFALHENGAPSNDREVPCPAVVQDALRPGEAGAQVTQQVAGRLDADR